MAQFISKAQNWIGNLEIAVRGRIYERNYLDAGSSKSQRFLSNLNDFSRFNQIYEEYFMEAKPARVTVQAARLPKEVLLEIEAIAVV